MGANDSMAAERRSLVHTEVTAGASPRISVRGLRKRFKREDGTVIAAIDGVDLDINPGELLVLLGPSGCGKTTLLRCIAGLERPDEGDVEIAGRTVFSESAKTYVRPEDRRVSMVFQSYALWPHMSALGNVAYPLRCRGLRRAEAKARAAKALETVGIGHLGRQMPNGMSGGQQQRVALARALVAEADVILFDEPLSNVDAKVREELRIELVAMQRALGFSAVYVTHDQAEAMEVAHRVAVMRDGRVVQLGAPAEIYERPVNWYVAQFIGTVNEISGRVTEIRRDLVRVDSTLGPVLATPAEGIGEVGDEVVVVARPEHFTVMINDLDARPESENSWVGTVETAMFSGPHVEYVVRIGETRVRVWQPGAQPISEGTAVRIGLPDTVRCLPVPA